MPLSSDLLAQLRLEVGRFRRGERRRRFDTSVHVGTPGGGRAFVVVLAKQQEHVDRQVRADLVSALLEVAPQAEHGWVTRSGPAVPDEEDTAWMVAADAAFGAAGRELAGFYAITREGWLDVRTGERKVWKRLRVAS